MYVGQPTKVNGISSEIKLNTQNDLKYFLTTRRKKIGINCWQFLKDTIESVNVSLVILDWIIIYSVPAISHLPGNTRLKLSDSIIFFFQTWMFQTFKERFLKSLIMNSSRKKERNQTVLKYFYWICKIQNLFIVVVNVDLWLTSG